ncbi:hypothetical protein WIW50_02020 [Flavobacteriaceae bacterium 3-367]|uniref:hypothetical protein n=1 Tax=Eudoraea algarum TaxID=3417568 RepID=UPI00326CC46D
MKRAFVGFLFFLMLGPATLVAQKKAKCTVTTQSGTEFTGYIKRYNIGDSMSGGFKLFKDKKKMWLYPGNLKKVVVNDTIVYRSLKDRRGDKSLMRLLVDGTPISLYLYSSKQLGNIPGENLSTWFVSEFYLEKEPEALTYVDIKELRQNPEAFFPDAPMLQERIKATKRDDIQLVAWVKAYNNTLEP